MTYLAAIEQVAAKDIDIDRAPPYPEREKLWDLIVLDDRSRLISFTSTPPSQLRNFR
jgi:hypothetical protein